MAESEKDVELRTRDGIADMDSVTEFEVDISDVVLRECVGEGSFGKGMAGQEAGAEENIWKQLPFSPFFLSMPINKQHNITCILSEEILTMHAL